jgi:hypothetical protein
MVLNSILSTEIGICYSAIIHSFLGDKTIELFSFFQLLSLDNETFQIRTVSKCWVQT